MKGFVSLYTKAKKKPFLLSNFFYLKPTLKGGENMRYILLVLFLAFGMGCQSMKAKNQSRKGWKRVDKEWFGQAPVSKKATARTPANSGDFICDDQFYNLDFPRRAGDWLNKSCDPLKNFTVFVLPAPSPRHEHGQKGWLCCIAK